MIPKLSRWRVILRLLFLLPTMVKRKVIGLEASASWQINGQWQIFGSLGLLETKVRDWPVRSAVEGRDLAHAPPYTINIGFSWG